MADATDPLTDDELVTVRRFMGYPAMGGINSSQQSWRFFRVYGFNEWRLRNLADAEVAQVRQYVKDIASLETAILTASDNLDTDQAAVWTHNKNEVQDRMGLFNRWRRQLCQFLGVPPGPGLRSANRVVI
ncbi:MULTISPECIES: hypothetical protein [Acetobacter]|uniref:Uncharacterized protein n=1 Tax=Acetobacter ascendens TaxID=481146 RepID=A0A1D8QXU2_9PROT|nr:MULTISPECIES: hypothetical protein [Acetobacter]GBR57869.1 hypothetical protein AA18889_1369 [Acetobacter senegalensis DSM 18889]GCD73974.1 hypothetical protein NBRC3299_0266 [Acetobacter pasteurianus NBRC 3299]AOW47146.1 hypothetical protein A4S02_10635 [Acetobacter ascendens]AOW48380.1 hypothetical protein A4R89_02005 [Acetobacter ascendens]ARW09964.1 hypothetical protein S101447_00862 [Acetobacter ascendens]